MRGVGIDPFVQMRGHHGRLETVIIGEEFEQVGARGRHFLARHVEFGAVARGQHHRLVGVGPARERFERGAETPGREIEALAEFDGRRLVAYAKQEQVHTGFLTLRNCGCGSGSSRSARS